MQETIRRPGSRGPLPTGKGKQIGVRMHDDMLKPLDEWIARQDTKLSRSEAIRLILKEHLVAQGLMAPDKER